MNDLKVIIVDDIKVEQKFIKKIIHKRNDIKEIVLASNGKEAFDTIKDDSDINLVITDYNMPIMSGLELIRQLRADERFNHLSIIILSAEVSKSNMLEAIAAGADMEILKPFSAHDLNSSIDYIFKPIQQEAHANKEKLKSRIKELEQELSLLRQELNAAES